MAIVLNGVTLNGSLQWKDRFGYSPVAQEVLTTLGGNPVVYSSPLHEGRPITLEATEDTGWLTYAMITEIEAMASVPGGVYTLNIHGRVFNVVFAHHEGNAIDFKPLQPKAAHDAEDPFIGVMKFITV